MNHWLEGNCEVVSMPSSAGSLARVGIFAETGQITLESCERHIRTMVLCSQNEDCHRFLVDLSESELVSSIGEQYKFAYERAEKIGLRRSWSIALLTAPMDESHDFLEIVVWNAGYRLRCFDDENAAVNWLVD
jgi:hypothetical protein